MNWKEVCIELNNEAAEAVSNIMNELGSNGLITEESNGRIRITAYYYNDGSFPALLENLKSRINKLSNFNLDTGKLIISLNDKCNEDWATSWHKYFKPLELGKDFMVLPSWENIEKKKRKIIKIDPGMAFGIGSHETTQMCIEFLEDYIIDPDKQKTMLDIGTGTGILSIAAAYLGIDKITAIDIDPAAVKAARDNIRINNVQGKVEIIKGDMAKDISGEFSIITANLLPDLIMSLLPSIPPLMDSDTKLILSGIISEKRNLILKKAEELNIKLIDEKSVNEWISLVLIQESV